MLRWKFKRGKKLLLLLFWHQWWVMNKLYIENRYSDDLSNKQYYLPETTSRVKNMHKTQSLPLRRLPVMVLVMIKKPSKIILCIFICRFSFFPFKPFTKATNNSYFILVGISLFLVYLFFFIDIFLCKDKINFAQDQFNHIQISINNHKLYKLLFLYICSIRVKHVYHDFKINVRRKESSCKEKINRKEHQRKEIQFAKSIAND